MIGISWDPHNGNTLVSGMLYKQQSGGYTTMPSNFVMYMGGASGGSQNGGSGSTDVFMGQATCSSGTSCTVGESDENNAGSYSQNKVSGSVQFSIDANGRATISGGGNQTPIFYLYDSSATDGGVMMSPGGVQVGNLEAQTVPTSSSSLVGTYYMRDLFGVNSGGSSESGALTMTSGNPITVTGTQDQAGDGYTVYADSLSGNSGSGTMTLSPTTAFATDGVFDIVQGSPSQTQVLCYTIYPICTLGPNYCGQPTSVTGSQPFGKAACMSPSDNSPKVTLVQQVQ